MAEQTPHDDAAMLGNHIYAIHVLLSLYNDTENYPLDPDIISLMYKLIKDYCTLSGFKIVPVNDGEQIGIKLPGSGRIIVGSHLID
jgi:hypothetical protein